MRFDFGGAIAMAAAVVALGGQATVPPKVTPPATTTVGAPKPPQRQPVTITPRAMGAGEITGRVIDTSSRAIAEATVWLVGQSTIQRGASDVRGRFTFTGVASGEYVVVARKRGYFDGAFGKKRPGGSPLPIGIGPGQAMSDLQIALFRSSVITGSVFDEANEPVIGAHVVAVRRYFAGGDWQFVTASSVVTDDQGRYRVYGLEPGEYIVTTPTTQVNAEWDEQFVAGGIPHTEKMDLAYPTLFYASSRHSLLALPVSLASGEVRYAVNFQWAPVPARAVSGRLVGDGAPVGGQIVKLVPSESREMGVPHEVAVTASAPDGTFAFERVPAGEYRLEAGGAFGPPRIVEINPIDPAAAPPDIYFGRVAVNVIDEDVTDVAVRMQVGQPVSGTVNAPGGGGPASRVSVAIVPAQPGLSRVTAPPVVNGKFESVPLVPGEYYVRVTSLPAGLYLRSITVNGRDVLDGPAALGGVDEPHITVSLTDAPSILAGSVRDARMLPAAGAAIIVLPAPATLWSPNRSRQTRASMNGQFAITGLPPGDYLIVAIDDAAAEGWQDERVLAQLRTLGTRVSLRTQERRDIQLRLSTVKR